MIRALLLTLALFSTLQVQQEVDPALRAVVDRFFATQVSEDIEGYLALWSRTAQRPQPQQLKFIFDSGDDKFLDLEIARASISGDTARVRGAVTRVRTALNSTNPDGSPRLFTTRLHFSLSLAREDGEWKLVREGAPTDELAAALVAAADPASRSALLKAEADLANSRLVDAVGRIADGFAQKRQYKAALDIYERGLEVARAIADAKAEGHMLQNVANSHYFLRDFPTALAFYEKRLALERSHANDEGVATALVGIGTSRYSTHEYTAALAAYREALAIQERLNDEGLVATTLISTANVQYLQGDFDGAIADYRRAESLKRKYFDLRGAAMALEGLGRTYGAQGDYGAALVAFAGVREQALKRNDTGRQASALQNIGDTHFKLGNADAARLAYDESRQLHDKLGDHSSAGRVWQGTAAVELMTARFSAAETAYGKSIASCTVAARDPDIECGAHALVGLGFAQAAQERYDDAIASYRKGISAFEQLKAAEFVGRARVGLAEALSGKEQYAAAIAEAINARRTAVAVDADDLLWRALVSQARAERKLGKKAESLGAAKAAVSAVRRMAAESLRRPGHVVPRDTATAYATAVMLYAEAADAASAWTTAEEMRAHTLRIALAPNERDIAQGMTEAERDAERAAVAELRPLFAQHDSEKRLPKPDAARLARLAGAINEAAGRRATAQQQLFARLPDLRRWRGLEPAATLDEIKGTVERGTLLMQFVLDDRDLVVLTAEHSPERVIPAAHVVAVRRQAIAERVARAVEASSLGDAESWRRASSELVKLLPAPVLTQLAAARRVVFVPDDMLWRIPFEALPIGAGYLGDNAHVTYAASVTAIVRAPSADPAPASNSPGIKVLVAAAPAIPAHVVETLKTTAPSWTIRPAESGRMEAEKLQTAIGESNAIVLTGTAATEEAVRAGAAEASVLHLAAPFRVNAASPLFSPVLLAPSESARDVPPARNGILELREVPTSAMRARLGIFSDPSSLSMREVAGVLPAVQWVLRAGGIETLIVRRWVSDDAATTELLAAFYQRLRSGSTPAEALRAATNAARSAGAPPQVWAGWLLIGSAR